MESVRGKMSAMFAIKKKCKACEHVEITHVSKLCHLVNKRINVLTKQHYAVKFCVTLKKSEVDTIYCMTCSARWNFRRYSFEPKLLLLADE